MIRAAEKHPSVFSFSVHFGLCSDERHAEAFMQARQGAPVMTIQRRTSMNVGLQCRPGQSHGRF